MLRLYNTLTKKIEVFTPFDPKRVTMYCCGPTVYDYAHIGNFRTYAMSDFLRRTLRYLGYPVKYVSNVTDVGHLVSDEDSGEDKMEKGARREGKTAWDIAKFYTDAFLTDSKKLHLIEPDVRPKPTEHIPEQIAMVAELIKKGYAYTIDDGIYFDTSKFFGYGALTGQDLEALKAGARVEVNPQKKHPTDFALWKFSPKGAKRQMEWESPWGMGFPGWHIECSAMIRKHLGEQIDIHTGGADLIPVHHTNEIAQSEAATGKHPFVRYWVHGQFIQVDGEKMAKSRGNFYRLADIEAKGFDPLALRYFYMTAHYRAFLNFTWEGLSSAAASLDQLRLQISNLKSQISKRTTLSEEKLKKIDVYQEKFKAALENDLNMPQALAVVWEVVKSNIPSMDKYDVLMEFDEVLGLELKSHPPAGGSMTNREDPIPDDIEKLVKQREQLRKGKKFAEADAVRKDIEERGYVLEDTPTGYRVKKNEIFLKSEKFHPKAAPARRRTSRPGLVVLFGSGEMSPTGRKIHEQILKEAGFNAPVHIGILETPTGFEVNAMHSWPARMEEFFKKGLSNYKPVVTRIRAWRRDGPYSSNDPAIVDGLLGEDYIYCGAGSPGYTIKHLKGTRAYENLRKAHESGSVLCLGSATAVAISRFALPVYEIFKAGADPYWLDGLDLFSQYGISLVVVPHWNNQEGEDFDTTCCWMGRDRFAKLQALLPPDTTILGIDEQTACVVDVKQHEVQVVGVGSATIVKSGKEQVFASGTSFPMSFLELTQK